MSRMPMSFLHAAKIKKTFKDACEQFDLVYFGQVSQHTDEHQMVRGFTLSPSHIDRHYCVGTVGGRDIILLERTDTISFPDKPSKAYTWLLVQIDLRAASPVHILLNACRYDAAISSTIVARLSHLHQFDQFALQHYDDAFTSSFRVFAPMQQSGDVARVIDQGMASVLGHHFSAFDYEIFHDTLIIYFPTKMPTLQYIEQCLKAGIWLAGELDTSIRSIV